MNSDALAARIGNLLGGGAGPAGGGAALPPRPPPPVPNHELLTRIGAGSYGEVWLARSVTGALRAVKVVWQGHFSSERPYEREFNGIVQFEPISRSHPGVVNVLHVGRDDAAGCFFYVMELADAAEKAQAGSREPKETQKSNTGNPEVANVPAPSAPNDTPLEALHSKPETYSPRTLASDLKQRGHLPLTEVIALGVQLAGALGHLHRHGLVHRDVKPSNVIFVQGQPKLADIGLVTGVHAERSFVGTEGFIPPEGPGSERGDLFALGRLLYEAATGKNRCDFPELPDDLDRWDNHERQSLIELNEVLARACAADAKKRHGSAAELAGDLNLILAGRSVRGTYQLERRLRYATFAAAAAMVIVVATVFSNWLQRRQRERSDAQARRESILREEAQRSLARAEAAERASQLQLYTALLEQARATVLSGELGQRTRALEAIRRAAAISNTVELRREVFAALTLPDLRAGAMLPHGDDVTLRYLDPTFERLAFCRGNGPVIIRAVADGRELATLPASTNLPAYRPLWSADRRYLAVKRDYPGGGLRADWELWDLQATSAPKLARLFRDVPRDVFAFHPRSPWILAGQRSGQVTLWNLGDGAKVADLPGNRFRVMVKFSEDGTRFASTDFLGKGTALSIHDTAKGSVLASNLFAQTVAAFAWHPHGHGLAVCDDRGNVHWMDAKSGESRVFGRHKSQARSVEFSPDGDYLLSGGWERELICWNARTLRREFKIGLDGFVAYFSADSRSVAIDTGAGIRIFAFDRPSGFREFVEDLGTQLTHASFSRDGRWLTASASEKLAVWDLTSGGPGAMDEEAHDTHGFFTADSSELFGSRNRGANDNTGFRWRLAPASAAGGLPELKRLPIRVASGFGYLSLSSNAVVMTSTNGSGFLDKAGIETGWLREGWQPTASGVHVLSPDGRWLGISPNYTRNLWVYRLPDLKPVARLDRSPVLGNINFFAFSPLGHELAVYSRRGVEFWSTATWTATRMLTNFSRPFLYAPDGRSFWAARDTRSAGLYDERTFEPRLLLPTGTLPLAVSPDGRQLAVSVDGQRLQVWDLAAMREQCRALGLEWDAGP